ncbi:33941_t:CDS:1, partial [Gigaspora margarita]
EENDIDKNIVDRLTIFIEELSTRRKMAKENYRHAQKRQKFYWDQKLKNVQRIFQKGDKVLLYDAAQ